MKSSTLLKVHCLYPDNINKIIDNMKAMPMVTGIYSFQTPNTRVVNSDNGELNKDKPKT